MINVKLGVIWAGRLAVGLLVMVIGANLCLGQMILIDNFDDGNAEGWTEEDYLDLRGGPGVFEVIDGEYNVRSTGSVPPEGLLGSAWEPSSSDAIYSNGLLRATVRNNVDRTDVGLAMRVTEDSAYWFHLSNYFAEPRIFISKISNGTFSWLSPEPSVRFPVSRKFVDFNMEAGIVRDQVSMKVWPVGDPEPLTPQYTVTDPTPLPNGRFGVINMSGGSNPSSFPLNATFDDIYFTPIPEPSAATLSILASLGLLTWRRLKP